MDNSYKTVSKIIRARRTVKPAKMNGKFIADENVMELLHLADWAPTHKITEPWRFIVYPPGKAKTFCLEHAELYKSSMPPEKFKQDKYEKFIGNGNYVSHIIVTYMKRSENVDIPVVEEIAAASAAIQNLLLGAAASGIAAFWSTGGMTHTQEFKKFLNINPEDIVLGIIYLGYTGHHHEGKRIIPLNEKITWK